MPKNAVGSEFLYQRTPAAPMDGFLLLLLEAGVALALLVFIVWWTWPSGRRRDGEDGGPDRR
jgi:hypothetical protein